jgi:NAD(P)H-flavin reductase
MLSEEQSTLSVTTPMLPRPFRVTAVRRETADTVTLELRAADGGEIPFGPGQFMMLYVFGIGEVPLSISGEPGDPRTLVHTVRAVAAVSRAVTQLKRGDTVGIRGPFGTQWPMERAEGHDLLVVAGGIGLAPLRPAILHVLNHRERFSRLVLLYGARSPNDLIYRRDLARWRSRLDIEVGVTVDSASTTWRGNVGVVASLIPTVQIHVERTIALICGPEVMMRFTTAELQQRGLDPSRIYISMERNMLCGIGLCGHCQLGPSFVCKDGPVFPLDRVAPLLRLREV